MANNQTIPGIWTLLGVVGFILLLAGSAAVIYPARLQYERQKEFYESTRVVADRVRAEREMLQKEVSALESSPAARERIARENYRLCKEGEIVLYYKKPAR